jgi:hypothetical protein
MYSLNGHSQVEYLLTMRRVIALSLMMLFSCTLIAPLFASGADAYVPACCRRNGKHHCMMERRSGQEKGITSVSEKCPYCPVGTCAEYFQIFKPESGDLFSAGVVRHLSIAPQTEALYCISPFRSHPKRGPPLA